MKEFSFRILHIDNARIDFRVDGIIMKVLSMWCICWYDYCCQPLPFSFRGIWIPLFYLYSLNPHQVFKYVRASNIISPFILSDENEFNFIVGLQTTFKVKLDWQLKWLEMFEFVRVCILKNGSLFVLCYYLHKHSSS